MSYPIFQHFSPIWKELVTANTVDETKSAIVHICETLGALRVSWTDRHFNLGDKGSMSVVRHHHNHACLDKETDEMLVEHYIDSPLPPPDYRNPDNYYGRALRKDNLLRHTLMPTDNRHFHDRLLYNYQSMAHWNVKEMILVPLPGLDLQDNISTVNFVLDNVPEPGMEESFRLASQMLRTAWNLNHTQRVKRSVQLSQKEWRVATWAIAGKTLEEISIITSIPARTVRHYLYSVRDRYGYATVQQMLIRVAKDYNIDP
ncbi:helix-turn-helix transcriptional regulator [Aestuariispira insulae]|uniref:DNA-binding CsgD family transcriptional regulator n=1 Tax=Aestuariispira insulae TaxID=1461337 RepID=A0A3D9H5H2_9PROT|nr:LuxR C-terminal-related transcriptional regulator [Aestuariispira insulae]RED44679.1 DNA-binding CsgD family transcriptional regulator [Aestuariispira insulae]